MKTKFFTIFTATILLVSCNKNETVDFNNTENLKNLDTIQSLAEFNTDRAIWNDHGVYRLVTKDLNNDPYEEHHEETDGKEGNVTNATCNNTYSGVDRKATKISFSSAATTTNYTFSSFRNTLQTDAFMKGLGISGSSTSNRVSQENRNVYITTSYLYAIKKEADGDYHLIIGDPNKGSLTNCEASGLPPSSASSYTAINNVKNAIEAKFGTSLCGKTSYTIFTPPILIDKIKGSLFFDTAHAAGVVGPTGYRPTTAWEIHPLSELVF
jgi:hypothetical protein